MSARKVMLLGEIGVGKSSLVRRLTLNQFDIDYKPTLGVNIYTYDVPESVLEQPTTLIIWDTDGNMRQSIFRHVYMREASAALIIGDATRPGTLDVMDELGEGFRETFPGRKHGFIINKSDLLAPGEDPPIPPALNARADDITITSAKTGYNVEEAFQRLAIAILRRDQ